MRKPFNLDVALAELVPLRVSALHAPEAGWRLDLFLQEELPVESIYLSLVVTVDGVVTDIGATKRSAC